MSNIGNRIKTRRIAMGYTQDELAKKMGYVSRSTIAKIEKGQHDVSQQKIVKFAEILETSVSFLMGWDSERTENIEKKADNDTVLLLTGSEEREFFQKFLRLDQTDKKLFYDMINRINK